MIDRTDEILKVAAVKLKEKYGNDFKFEDGDEFVFTLHDGVLMLSQEDNTLKIKVLFDSAIPLNMAFGWKEGAE